jgi:hypothetical protein
MPKRCYTCTSPFVQEIDDLILKGWKYKSISRHLKKKYPDSEIPTYESIRYHAKNHVIDMVLREEKAIKNIENYVEESIDKADDLKKEIEVLITKVEKAWKFWVDQENMNSQKMEYISDTLLLSHTLIEKIRRLRDDPKQALV